MAEILQLYIIKYCTVHCTIYYARQKLCNILIEEGICNISKCYILHTSTNSTHKFTKIWPTLIRFQNRSAIWIFIIHNFVICSILMYSKYQLFEWCEFVLKEKALSHYIICYIPLSGVLEVFTAFFQAGILCHVLNSSFNWAKVL